MYNQPEMILGKYGLSAEKVAKGRGSYICSTADGILALCPFNGSGERAGFLYRYMIFLKEQGMETEQLILTEEGEPLAEDDAGNRYVLKTLIRGSECSTRKKEEMREAAGLLARYHLLAETFDGEIPEFLSGGLTRTQQCRKHIRELVQVKNYIRNRRQKNEFDRLFSSNYPYFIDCAKKALQQLEQEGEQQRLLCHGNTNQHHVLKAQDGYRLVGFERMTWDSPMADLSTFMRKMMEKNNWRTELGRELLDAYGQVRPISEKERDILEIYLLFPEKYWKIANHYSNSHKAWPGVRDVEKLRRVIDQEGARQNFLESVMKL